MNKQEAIKKLQSESRHHCGERECYKDGCTKNVELDIAIDIVNQIDEPEKPILPQFIADYIASEQRSYSTLSEAIDNMDDEKEVLCWFYDNSETFAKAWLFGYEVEKEKLYTVELPNPNSLDYLMLQKDRRGKISVAWYCTDRWREDERVRLTEAEIKKDFEWAWQFAEEVEE